VQPRVYFSLLAAIKRALKKSANIHAGAAVQRSMFFASDFSSMVFTERAYFFFYIPTSLRRKLLPTKHHPS
jgi:hypothetical protein